MLGCSVESGKCELIELIKLLDIHSPSVQIRFNFRDRGKRTIELSFNYIIATIESQHPLTQSSNKFLINILLAMRKSREEKVDLIAIECIKFVV